MALRNPRILRYDLKRLSNQRTIMKTPKLFVEIRRTPLLLVAMFVCFNLAFATTPSLVYAGAPPHLKADSRLIKLPPDGKSGKGSGKIASGAVGFLTPGPSTAVVQTKYWTGTTSADWSTADNWDPLGVPDHTSEVIISGQLTDPVIGPGVVAAASSVLVEIDGRLDISDGAELHIANAAANGLEVVGQVYNEGVIFIDYTGQNGIFAVSYGRLENKAGGQINIGQNGGGIGDMGIFLESESELVNQAGTINIDHTVEHGLCLAWLSVFTNEQNGQILLGLNGGLGGSGILAYNSSRLINDNGLIEIDHTGLSDPVSKAGILALSSMIVTNRNNAQLLIGQGAGIGDLGVYMIGSSQIINDNSVIMIDRTGILTSTGDGLRMTDGARFENRNNAQLLLGLSAPIGRAGILMAGTASLVNNNATLNIDQSAYDAIQTQSSAGVLNENTGHISISENRTVGGPGLSTYHDSWVTNGSCSTFLLHDSLYNSATINNSGHFTINTAKGHTNDGSFTNEGILEVRQSSAVPNLINNEFHLPPTASADCEFVSPAFTLGDAIDFTVLGIYQDAGATQIAGTYDVSNNTFTPSAPLSAGIYDLYLEIEDSANGCTHLVSWELTITANCCPTVNFNDFESPSGWGIWNDGGANCRRDIRDAAFAGSGDFCVRLNNHSNSSVMTTANLDLSAYDELTVDFGYYVSGFSRVSDDFWLQISTDGGANFVTVEEWNVNDEFVNDQFYTDQVLIQGPFTTTTQLRFRCDASNKKDRVYIDDVHIAGCITGSNNLQLLSGLTSGSRIEKNTSTKTNEMTAVAQATAIGGVHQPIREVRLFPNPSGEESTIYFELTEPVESRVIITDITGRPMAEWKFFDQSIRQRIDLHQYEAGVYLVRLYAGGRPVTLKLLVVK